MTRQKPSLRMIDSVCKHDKDISASPSMVNFVYYLFYINVLTSNVGHMFFNL